MHEHPPPERRPFTSLSVKLIAVIVLVVILVEIPVYLPSLASYRASWLDDRLRVGGVAVRVFDTVPDIMDLPSDISDPLLQAAGAIAIVYRHQGQSELIALDASTMPSETVLAETRGQNPLSQIVAALDTLINGGDRTIRIVGEPPGAGGTIVEVVMPEAPLRADMLVYSRNILLLSLVITALAAIVLFVFAERLLIGPIRRLSARVIAFRTSPEAVASLPEVKRNDELGVLERELNDMQADIYAMLRQRRHLAELGLAVAKINHDLRNMLTSAQLLSDQVATLDDPKVNRIAPRLVATLDRATAFAQTVIDYGRQREAPSRPQPVDLRALGTEAATAAGLMGHPEIAFDNTVPDDTVLKVDPDQFSRVLTNLMKNAREALELAEPNGEAMVRLAFDDQGDTVRIVVSDNGPGLPQKAKDNLFVAFEGSVRAGGTGLGLAIARELTEANGGTISLVEEGKGATFVLSFPADRLV